MLAELHVRDLGVIADLTLVLNTGMTVLTGETGAGKTLVVEAIELLLGSRADPVLVRAGSVEASVEGRFVGPDGEVVVRRVVPRTGRSRCYLDGRLASTAELAELGRSLVDLYGQHAHQSLLDPRVQRAALDRFGQVDLAPLVAAQRRLGATVEALDALGGDDRARAREMDMLAFQVEELAEAALIDPEEDLRLEAEEEVLADASAIQAAAAEAYQRLAGDDGGLDAAHAALAALGGRDFFAEAENRLRIAAAELADAASALRRVTESVTEDPQRAEEVRARRRLLRALERKYGDGLLAVMTFEAEARTRLAELTNREGRAEVLEAQRAEEEAAVGREAVVVAVARRAAAPLLASAIEGHLQGLAMPRARLEVAVDGHEGETVTFLLGANGSDSVLPLAKIASGGELARTMLAARLVLSDAPPTLIFDEVDAGIGGEAAVSVGRALAALGGEHQVLVVTHLPQVAAFADHQVAVTKADVVEGATRAQARTLDDHERVVELSRMLSGQPDSVTARRHAAELLAGASRPQGDV